MSGKNPCDVCTRKKRVSRCYGCVLDHSSTYGECGNDGCYLNYELGCLLGLDDVCKASTCYEDDYRDHDCRECEIFRVGADGLYYCEYSGENISTYNTACEDFIERVEE